MLEREHLADTAAACCLPAQTGNMYHADSLNAQIRRQVLASGPGEDNLVEREVIVHFVCHWSTMAEWLTSSQAVSHDADQGGPARP